jgi:hypothetical protein
METEGKINEILFKISELLDVPTQFVNGDDQKVHPSFDVDGISSKLIGLLVFAGVNVSPQFAPTYHRVHADVDYWKRRFESEPAPASSPPIPSEVEPATPESPPPGETHGASEP